MVCSLMDWWPIQGVFLPPTWDVTRTLPPIEAGGMNVRIKNVVKSWKMTKIKEDSFTIGAYQA